MFISNNIKNSSVIDFNNNSKNLSYDLIYSDFSWKPSIEWVDNAFVSAQTVRDNTNRLHINNKNISLFNGCVYRANGEVVFSSLHRGSGDLVNIADLDPKIYSLPDVRLEGTWLFGGLLKVDFGHFLTESLGRLWALQHLSEKIEGVVFIIMNGVPNPKFANDGIFTLDTLKTSAKNALTLWPFIHEILNILCPTLKIHVVGIPTHVERLIVPSQLMGLCPGDLIGGHQFYRDALRSSFGFNPPSAPRKLYVSRAGMSVKSGKFFAEEQIEGIFESQGFTIVRPENLSITQQLEIYSSHSHIVLATGSASHMLALNVGHFHKIVLLHRHPKAWRGFRKQLEIMGAGEILELDLNKSQFTPRHRTSQEMISARMIYEIDFPKLWNELIKFGFVDGEAPKITNQEIEREKTLFLLSQSYGGVEFCVQDL